MYVGSFLLLIVAIVYITKTNPDSWNILDY